VNIIRSGAAKNPTELSSAASASTATPPHSHDSAPGGDGRNGKRFRFAPLAVAGAAFLMYLCCLAPTVTYGGDCGELIAASYRLGIAHPTGYPLYCLLGRLFATLIPFGEIGWRYNLFSAVAGAATAGMVCATVLRILPSSRPMTDGDKPSPTAVWAAAGASLLLAGSYYFGSQSVIAEVYVLSALLLCALITTAVAWHQSVVYHATPNWRYCYLLAFLFGLALNTHLSCIFLAPGLWLYVVVQHRSHWSLRLGSPTFKRFATILGCLLLSYSLTLYLPLRSAAFPEPPAAGNGQFWWNVLDWGHPVDFPRWLAHVTGRQYRTQLLTPHDIAIAGRTLTFPWFTQEFPTTLGKLKTLADSISLQYLWFTPLILAGLLTAFRPTYAEARRHSGGGWLGTMLLSIVVLNVGVQIHYEVGDYTNFFFPTYVVIAIWMGLGLHWLFDGMQQLGRKLAQRSGQPTWRWRMAALSVAMLFGTVGIQWMFFVPLVSNRGNTAAREAGLERAAAAETLATTTGKQPALLLLNDNTLFSFWYVQQVLGRATEARTLWGPPRRRLSAEDRLVELVAQQQKEGAVALAQWDEKTDSRFPYTNLTPGGILWRASPRVLPEPAIPISLQPKNATPGTIVRAAFRRPRLQLQELAAFEIDFTLPPFAAEQGNYLKLDAPNRAAHAGWIEVLIARRGVLKQPPPDQPDLRIVRPILDSVSAWRQTRRLVVPIGAKAGTPLRTVLPLQPEVDSPTGDCEVWVRLIADKTDRTTPWHPAAPVILTQR